MTNHDEGSHQITTERDKRLKRRKTMKRGVVVHCRRGLSGLSRDILKAIVDFNDSGMSLEVSEELKVGDELEMELIGVGRGKPLKIPSVVRWIEAEDEETFSVGVQFRKKIPYVELANYC